MQQKQKLIIQLIFAECKLITAELKAFTVRDGWKMNSEKLYWLGFFRGSWEKLLNTNLQAFYRIKNTVTWLNIQDIN